MENKTIPTNLSEKSDLVKLATGPQGIFHQQPLAALDILIFHKVDSATFNDVLSQAFYQIQTANTEPMIEKYILALNYIQNGLDTEGTKRTRPQVKISEENWNDMKQKALATASILNQKYNILTDNKL